MDGNYSQVGAPPNHMMSYFQGMAAYNMGQGSSLPSSSSSASNSRLPNAVSIWAGDLDAYMDETFLRQAVTASGWGADISRIKVVRDHYSGMHAGYAFLDAASPEAAQRVISTGSGMPIPGTNRCWRLNMGRNATLSRNNPAGLESNVYVGNLEPVVTDYQLMTAFRPRYASVRHAKVVCNEYGQSRGYGFVRFGNPQEADRAVSEMHGYVFNQKPIRLSPAAGRTRHGGSHAGSGSGGMHGFYHVGASTQVTNKRPRQLMSPDDPNNTTLFIGGTSSHVTDDLLWREFSSFGELEAVRVPVNKTGFVFVRFKRRECAQRAKDEVSHTHFVSLNPSKPVRIEWATEQISVQKSPVILGSDDGFHVYGKSYSTVLNDGVVENGFLDRTQNGSRGSMCDSARVSGHVDDGECNLNGAVVNNKLKDVDNINVHDGIKKADSARADGNSGGETEPPSKRVAVGRPEYAGNDIACGLMADRGQVDCAVEEKPEVVSDESSAMQFSWLNASTQTTSNGH